MAELLTSKIGAFIDLSTIKVSYKMFVDAISSFASNLVYIKYYNYVPSKHFEFLNIPCKLIEYEKSLSNKPKTKIDIRQAIDIAKNFHSENQIFCLLISEVDSEYLLEQIKSNNKKVILLQSSQSSITKYADTSVIINRNAEFVNTPYIQFNDTIDKNNAINSIQNPLVYKNFSNDLSINNAGINANPNDTHIKPASSDITKALVYKNFSNDLSINNVDINAKPNDTHIKSASSDITKALVYENFSNDLSTNNSATNANPNDTHIKPASSDITKALVYKNFSNDLSINNAGINANPNDTHIKSASSDITKALVYKNFSNDLSTNNSATNAKPNATQIKSASSDITKALETLISATKQNKLNYLKEKYGHLIK